MRSFFTVLTLLLVWSSSLFAADGLISIKSDFDVKTTADRLEKILNEKGMTVFARIDHALGAKKTGQELRPTELVIFGNPKVGTPLMKCAQTIAIDLPQKAVIWQDKAGSVWIGYNDPDYLVKRHRLTGCEKVINKVKKALATFTQKAAKK